MNDFRFDESRAPLIVVTFPPTVTADQCIALFQRFLELARKGSKIGYVMDLRQFNPLSANAAMRKVAADAFAERRSELLRATLCEARVVDGPVLRGVLTAFDWLTGQKWPCDNFTTMEDAERWVRAKLSAEGIHLRAAS
ncbi:hypothetical protein A7982_13083 [Minicystis rosea]|nr:hypothetical protein A7982_13083 [Minicystis rosea]